MKAIKRTEVKIFLCGIIMTLLKGISKKLPFPLIKERNVPAGRRVIGEVKIKNEFLEMP